MLNVLQICVKTGNISKLVTNIYSQYEKQKIVIYSGRNVHVKLSGFLQRS